MCFKSENNNNKIKKILCNRVRNFWSKIFFPCLRDWSRGVGGNNRITVKFRTFWQYNLIRVLISTQNRYNKPRTENGKKVCRDTGSGRRSPMKRNNDVKPVRHERWLPRDANFKLQEINQRKIFLHFPHTSCTLTYLYENNMSFIVYQQINIRNNTWLCFFLDGIGRKFASRFFKIENIAPLNAFLTCATRCK